MPPQRFDGTNKPAASTGQTSLEQIASRNPLQKSSSFATRTQSTLSIECCTIKRNREANMKGRKWQVKTPLPVRIRFCGAFNHRKVMQRHVYFNRQNAYSTVVKNSAR